MDPISSRAVNVCRIYPIKSIDYPHNTPLAENLRLWTIDRVQHKLTFEDVTVGKLRREFTGMSVNSIDEHMYVGTMSGDVAKIRLNCHHDPAVLARDKAPILLGVFGRHIAKRPVGKDCEKYQNGVRALVILSEERLVIGAGDGTVEMVVERDVKFKDYPAPAWPQLKSVSMGGVFFFNLLRMVLEFETLFCFFSLTVETHQSQRCGFVHPAARSEHDSGGYGDVRNLQHPIGNVPAEATTDLQYKCCL